MSSCYNNINVTNLLYDGQRVMLSGIGLMNEEGLQLDERTANYDINFWAPEAISRGKLDWSSDLYSAGMLLYFMLVGKFPFEASKIDKYLSDY
jgi:serine/threonine protein kinase